MTTIKKVDIVIQEKDFKEIAFLIDKYKLLIKSGEYDYYLQFYKIRGRFNLDVSVMNKNNDPIVDYSFDGTSDILSLFDKVYNIQFIKKNIKTFRIFLKLDCENTLKMHFWRV